ncbi:endonuclease/Exonuclease/phosphatase [Podospora conica]|nr:endonuclease/Exonuclease/phosphatase [Schizothecium conicum]
MRPSHALLLPATANALLTTGLLPLLTINIAGLPSILQPNGVPGSKTTNTALLGTLLSASPYALIHLQEDFNYHAALYSTTTSFPHRTATSGGVPFGSGLNTLSRLPSFASDVRRIKWTTCSSASGADCLTPKGFTFMRLLLASERSGSEAAYVDVYNLHTDAGGEPADLAARQANMEQVLGYIDAWSVGNAVVVAGDTNSRYSRVADTGLRGFLAAGFRDAWVEVERGGVVPGEESLCENPSLTDWCETVDKVLFRGGGVVGVGAEGFGYVGFRGEGGGVLTDHNPVAANLSWTVGGRGLRQSEFRGGPHGARWFNDVGVLGGKGGRVKTAVVVLRGGSRLDGVGVVLEDGTRLTHGGSGGKEVVLNLARDEFWVEAELCQGQKDGRTRNFYLRAGTSAGRSLAAGTRTGDCAVLAAPSGWQVVGFMGQDGDEVDQLALVYAPR